MNRPDFLIFIADEMQSFSLGCNGNPDVKTPNIDRLAREGCTFRRAYCNNPVCMPSRATLLTGLTPRQHGCVTNGMILQESVPTLTKALTDQGYRTHSIGKIHLQPVGSVAKDGRDRPFSWEDRDRWDRGEIKSLPPSYYGFQTTELVNGHVHYCFGDYRSWLDKHYPGMHAQYGGDKAYAKGLGPSSWRMEIPPSIHYNHWIGDRSIAFLEDLKQDENYFLWCSFPDPHVPFAACRPYSEMYDPNEISISQTWDQQEDDLPHLARHRNAFFRKRMSESEVREVTAQTYGMITHIDDNIGRITKHLESIGRLDNTILVFMADHGEYLGCHGLLYKNVWMYEEMIRVPFVWRVPDAYGKGGGSDLVTSLLDFVPTILEYAGIPLEALDNRGEGAAERKILPGRSLKSFLSRGILPEDRPALLEYDEDWLPGPFYRVRSIVGSRYKLTVYPIPGEGVLTDLEQDPLEKNNLWSDPEYAGIKAQLMEQLLIDLVKTDRLDQRRITGA